MSNVPENIDKHWADIKNALFSGAAQVVGHVPKGRHKIWLTVDSWKRIGERKGLKTLLTATSIRGRDRLELGYRAKSREVYRRTRRDKNEFPIVLVREGKMPQIEMISDLCVASPKGLHVDASLSIV